MILASACVRIAFLGLTTALFGDAVTYARVAEQIAQGDYADVDPFWCNLFCLWEALFPLMGLSPLPSAILASLIPGILLVIPVALLANALYGEKTAWLASGLTILHPRLVEYSCNGYSESFYLCAYAFGIMWLTLALKSGNKGYYLAFGGAFGIYLSVRNEGIIPFVLCLTGILLTQRSQALKILLYSLTGFAFIFLGYILLSEMTVGTSGFLEKHSLLNLRYSEQVNWHKAAEEVYGKRSPEPAPDWRDWVEKAKGNLLYTLTRLPDILVTPLWLFALGLPFFSRRLPTGAWPLLIMLFFPLLFYPLLRVEPRYFFSLLIPLQIFGSAGLLALAGEKTLLYRCLAAALLLLSLAISIYRGLSLEHAYRYQRELAHWIKENIPEQELLIGDGYGLIGTTAFLTHSPFATRLWTTQPEEIVEDVRLKKGRWLLLYERFLLKANPEILPVLEQGLPGMKLRHEIKDHEQHRVQIYELDSP